MPKKADTKEGVMRTLAIVAASILALGIAGWLGLPWLFTALGFHPRYTGPCYELTGGKALIVTTSHDELGRGGKKTGVFGSELTAPYYEFLDGGMTVDVASIRGGEIPIDPSSFIWFIEAPSDKRYQEDPAFQAKVKNSMKIDDVDFAPYDIIFLSGGWGAAYDLGTSETLGRKITEAWAAGKVVGGVCHGPLGLLLAKDETGEPLVKGRHLTAVTNRQVEQLGISITPQHPERELRSASALFESENAFLDMFANHTVVDGRLLTGQNQNAAPEVAEKMMRAAGGRERS
jgi:putative intracellular protease/amidase